MNCCKECGSTESDEKNIESLGRAVTSTRKVFELFQRHVFPDAAKAVADTKLSAPTVRSAISRLQKLSTVDEITDKQRNRVFVYKKYMNILQEGMEDEAQEESLLSRP
jgi:Fic family protein